MADPKTQAMQVSLPGAGKTQTYQLSADTPIHFGFDLAEAVFTGKNGNLEIALEGGGTVILEGYQELADAGSLPTFEMMNGEVVAGDVYLFAFADVTDATAEELETAADGAATGSGAGEYSDDPGSLGDGLDALGGQDDAYGPNGAPTISGILGNIAPVANDDFAEVNEAGDPDLVLGKNIAFVEGGYEGNYQDYIEGRDGAAIDPDQVTFLPTDENGGGILLYNPNPPQGGATVSGEPGSVNYLVVLDTSGSMRDEMADAKAALVEMLETLQQQLNESGGTATIGIVDFDGNVQDVVTFQLSANTDPSDLTNTAIDYINDPSNLYAGGLTNFESALDAAVDWVNDPSAGANGNETHTIFISDGYGGSGFEDELATLQAISNVIGVGIGSGADESALDNIDESGEAIIVNGAEDLNSILVDLINNTGPASAEGNVIDNDYDPDGNNDLLLMNTINYVGENHDGVNEPGVEVITDDTVVMGKYGVLVIDPDGSWDYALNQEWADELNEGESFDEVFNYTIVDGEGAESNLASLTITVFGSNDMPVAVDDFNVQAVEYGDSTDYGLYADVDDAESGNVIVHDEDHQDYTQDSGDTMVDTARDSMQDTPDGEPDGDGDNFFVQVTGNVLAGDAAGGGTDSDPDSGDLPDGQTTFVLGVYSHATMDLAYEVPVEGNTGEPFDFKAMHPDQTFDIATLPDGLDTSYTVHGEFGYLTVEADGDYFYTLYTPNDEDGYENLNALNYDNPGTDEFTYAIMDDSGAFSYANLTFTVNGANDAPEAFSNENSVIEFGEEHILAGLTEADYAAGTATGNVITDENSEGMTDFDVDNDDVTGIFVESISHGENAPVTVYNYDDDSTDFVTIDGDYGTLKIWEDGTYEYQVDNDNLDVQGLNYQGTLTETFTYVTTNKYVDGVNSEDASSEPATLTITINGTNDAPIGVDDVPTEVFVDDWSGAIALDSGDGYSIGGMTFTASIEGHESTLSVTSQGLGVSSWLLDDPAIDGAHGDESVRIDFDNAMSSVEIELGGFNPNFPGWDDAKATMYDAEGNELGSVSLDTGDGSTLNLSSADGNIAYVVIETAGDANDDFFIESVRATQAETPEGGIVAVENVTESDFSHYDSYTTLGAVQVGGNVLANDWDYDNVDYPETGYPDGSTELSVTGIAVGEVADYADVPNNVSGTTTIVGTYGTLTIDSNGHYTYNPDQLAAQQLNVEDRVEEVFTYSVEDPYHAERSATLTIQVQGTNDGPEAHCDHNGVQYFGTYSTTVSDFSDVDGAVFTAGGITFTALADGGNPQLAENSDGLGVHSHWFDRDAIDNLGPNEGVEIGFTDPATKVTVEFGGYGDWDDMDVTVNFADGKSMTLDYHGDFDGTLELDFGMPISSVVIMTTDELLPTDSFYIKSVDVEGIVVGDYSAAKEAGDRYGDVDVEAIDLTGNVLLNDTDIDNADWSDNPLEPVELTVSQAYSWYNHDLDQVSDGTPAVLEGRWGTLTLNADGSYVYEVDATKTQGLDEGMQVEDLFSYEVTDPGGKTDVTTLTIDVNGTNDNPNAVDNSNVVVELGDGPTQGPEFGPFSDDTARGNVRANDSDDDDWNSQLRINGIAKGDLDDDVAANYDADDFDGIGGMPTAIAGDWGTLTINQYGQYQYTLNEGATDPLNGDEVEYDTFTYRVIDDNGDFDLATLTFTVYGNNDAPVAFDNVNALTEAAPESDSFMTAVAMDDHVSTDHAQWTSEDFTITAGTASVSGDAVNFAKGGTELRAGYNNNLSVKSPGDDHAEIDTNAGAGKSEAVSIGFENPMDTVTINLSSLYNGSPDAGHMETARLAVYDADGNWIKNVDVDGSSNGHVSVTLNADDLGTLIGSVVLVPLDNTAGNNAYNSDFQIDSISGTSTVQDGSEVSGNVITDDDGLGLDMDPDFGDSMTIASFTHGGTSGADGAYDVEGTTYAHELDGSYGTLYYNDDGSYTYVEDPSRSDQLSKEQAGTDVFTYTVEDTSGVESNQATLTINITGTNDAPTAEDFAVITDEDTPLSIDVLAHATDVDLLDTLSIDGITDPAHGSVEIVNGEVLYTPDADYNGDDSFTYTVTDGQGGSVTETVNVTVNPVNDAPVTVGDMDHGIMLTEEIIGTAGTAYNTIDFSDTTPTHDYFMWIDFGDGDPTWWEEASNQGVTISARNNSSLGESVVASHEGIGVDTAWRLDSSEVNAGRGYLEELVIDFAAGRGEVTVELGHLYNSETASVVAYDAEWNPIDSGTASSSNGVVTLDATSSALIAHVILTPNGDSDFTLNSINSSTPGTETRDVTANVANVSGNVLANDYDIDNAHNELTAVLMGSAVGMYGELVLDTNGTYTYTVDDAKIDDLHDSYVETFQYQVSDGAGGTETATLYIPLHYEDLNEVTGNNSSNTLYGTAEDDVISGLKGGDSIHGYDGDDVIFGDKGHDHLYGDGGNDMLFGDKGDDVIYASAGDDTVTLGEGADTIVIDPSYIGDNGASLKVIDFNVAEGDALQLHSSLTGTNVDITSNNSDITLTFTDLNHDGTATTSDILQVVLEGVNPGATNVDIHVDISDSADLNSLIQHIIDSPDGTI